MTIEPHEVRHLLRLVRVRARVRVRVGVGARVGVRVRVRVRVRVITLASRSSLRTPASCARNPSEKLGKAASSNLRLRCAYLICDARSGYFLAGMDSMANLIGLGLGSGLE